ncbi:lipoprotein insertase outer membrane protein LolB [Salinivibrio socompensis]|uniref:lipoprotein insertase outer membrane protein LolB n=1 Tax=Salinivibrio socompensis TaxID=1510206 RepID=UPI003B847010
MSVLTILFTVLTGCTTAPAPTTEWQTHRAALSAIDSYTARGKVAFIASDTRFSANLYWHHTPNASTLRLTNFLGTTLLSLTMNAQGATLIDDQGKQYQDPHPARLIRLFDRCPFTRGCPCALVNRPTARPRPLFTWAR